MISAAGFSLSNFYRSETLLLPVVDEDRTALSTRLIEDLAEVAGLEPRRVSFDEARRLVGQSPLAAALLTIPDGFERAIRSGKPAPLILESDPVKHLEVVRLRGAVEKSYGAMLTIQIASRVALVQVMTAAGDVDFEALSEDSQSLAETLLDQVGSLEERNVSGGPVSFNTFDQNVPGFSVTFLMLGMLFGVGLGLMDEKEWGMLSRLSASPVRPGYLVGAKVTSRVLVGCVQLGILFAFGRWAFDISLGTTRMGLVLIILGVSFASAALGLLLASIAVSRDAVLPLGTMAIVAMAAVGGCWWPISMEPVWLQNVAHVFPTAWAMRAFNDLMLRQHSLSQLLPSIGLLFFFGVAYLSVGSFLFWRRIARAG